MRSKTTSTKVIVIDAQGRVIVYKNKGILSRHINVNRDTIVNWFRESNVVRYNDMMIYKADRFVVC